VQQRGRRDHVDRLGQQGADVLREPVPQLALPNLVEFLDGAGERLRDHARRLDQRQVHIAGRIGITGELGGQVGDRGPAVGADLDYPRLGVLDAPQGSVHQ
jgi:hypothetical protein